MDLSKLTIHDCVEMSEKEQRHVVIHAGKVTDVVASDNKGIQENAQLSYATTEIQASIV